MWHSTSTGQSFRFCPRLVNPTLHHLPTAPLDHSEVQSSQHLLCSPQFSNFVPAPAFASQLVDTIDSLSVSDIFFRFLRVSFDVRLKALSSCMWLMTRWHVYHTFPFCVHSSYVMCLCRVTVRPCTSSSTCIPGKYLCGHAGYLKISQIRVSLSPMLLHSYKATTTLGCCRSSGGSCMSTMHAPPLHACQRNWCGA